MRENVRVDLQGERERTLYVAVRETYSGHFFAVFAWQRDQVSPSTRVPNGGNIPARQAL